MSDIERRWLELAAVVALTLIGFGVNELAGWELPWWVFLILAVVLVYGGIFVYSITEDS